ncbi:MAG TPA: nodulation protein NfeD [Acetobacteraceae bacterium]|nr:nodulation protein NfeD [Acetobacteraceae bacterium]
MRAPALLAPAFLAVAVMLGGMPPTGAAIPKRAEILTIDGAIGPAMADYVVRGIAAANPAEDGLIVLRMDTPGGLERAMRAIIRAILASPVPVVAYVAPSGARAASAGTYIAYAAAIAAMAPGTNLGAATPVTLGALGQTNKPDAETQKTVNDAIAYIRGLAELSGRNADWAEEAVRGAASLSATEALQQHVINVIAPSLPALLRQIDGMTLMLAGRPVRLASARLVPFPRAPDWRTRFLSVITDPSLAYLLMLLGIWGLVFEILNPGGVLPGLIGAISLLLASLGLGLLPIDYAGAGLVLLGVALMLAEIFIGAFGVIGLAGIVAFAIGSVVMFHTTAPTFGLPLAVVLAATLATAAFFLAALTLLLRARQRPIATGGEALIGAEAAVLSWQGTAGTVRVMGEIWQARSEEALQPASRVTIRAREGLVLIVAPARPAAEQKRGVPEKGEPGRGRTP